MSEIVISYLGDIILHTAQIWFFMLLVGLPIRMLTTVITKGRIEFM